MRLPVLFYSTTISIALVIYFFLSLTRYLGAGHDDTFISLWAGRMLAEGKGFVDHNFEPLEVSSSLLHTFIIAGMYLFTPEHVFLFNKLLGLLSGAAILLLIYLNRSIFLNFSDNWNKIAFALICLALSTSPSFLYWNLGGLETPLQTLILFLYSIYLIKHWNTSQYLLTLAFLQSLYILVRPEGFLVLTFTLLYSLTYHYGKQKFKPVSVLILLGIPLILFAILLGIRFAFFDMFFPNPVYAKVSLGNTSLGEILLSGIKYLIKFYSSNFYPAAISLVILFMLIYYTWISLTPPARLLNNISEEFFYLSCLGLVLLNHTFILLVGGDWMRFSRFIVPVIPLLVILSVTFSIKLIMTMDYNSHKTMFILTFFFSTLIILQILHPNHLFRIRYSTHCLLQSGIPDFPTSPVELKAFNQSLILTSCAHKRDWDGILPFIKNELPKFYHQFHQHLTIVTPQMGFFPYHVRQTWSNLNIYFIDTAGLSNKTIAHMSLPKSAIGLNGAGAILPIMMGKTQLSQYVLSKNPNLIYLLDVDDKTSKILGKLGWIKVWSRYRANVFAKSNPSGLRRVTSHDDT